VGGSANFASNQWITVRGMNEVRLTPSIIASTGNGELGVMTTPENDGAYLYDAIGNLIADQYEKTTVFWTPPWKESPIIP